MSKIEILNDNQFVDTKEGYATTFTITAMEQNRRWEFDMENGNMKGHWSGIFTSNDGKTEINFTEDVVENVFYEAVCESLFEKAAKTIYFGFKKGFIIVTSHLLRYPTVI